MNILRFSAVVSFALLAGCAAQLEPNEPVVEQSDEALSAKKTCKRKTKETSCLAVAGGGCAWGDRGKGRECFYVGPISAQPTVPAPTVPQPTVCTHNTNETRCMAETGCAWGDLGSGLVCFFIGEVVPQAH